MKMNSKRRRVYFSLGLFVLLAGGFIFWYCNKIGANIASGGFISGSLIKSSINVSNNEIINGQFSITRPAAVRLQVVRKSDNKPVRTVFTSEAKCGFWGMFKCLAKLNPGTYIGNFDGKDNSGKTLPVGDYRLNFEATTSGKWPAKPTLSSTTDFDAKLISVIDSNWGAEIKIDSVSQNVVNPSIATDKIDITYTIPKSGSYRMYVQNSDAISNGPVTYWIYEPLTKDAGQYTNSWNGFDRYGQAVADGYYNIIIEGEPGLSVTKATTTVRVLRSATDGVIKINTILPESIDPTKNQSTDINYTLPKDGNYKMTIKNSSNSIVKAIFDGPKTASTYTEKWDGKNSNGQIVSDGSYSIVVEPSAATKTIQSAQGVIKVSSVPPVVVAPSQTIEIQQSGIYEGLKQSSPEFGISFYPTKTGTINKIYLQWKNEDSTPREPQEGDCAYGCGNRGTFKFEIRTDNPTTHYPSDTVIATATRSAIDGTGSRRIGGTFNLPIIANFTAGQRYHLVIKNVDVNPSANYSTPNGGLTRPAAYGLRSGEASHRYDNNNTTSSWQPYCAYFGNTSRPWCDDPNENGMHYPVGLVWSDGSVSGDPYYAGLNYGGDEGKEAYWQGSFKAGEKIAWNGATITVTKVSLPLEIPRYKSAPNGTLNYHLSLWGSTTDLASGTMAAGSEIGPSGNPTWVTKSLSKPVTLENGKTYFLWFEAPQTSGSAFYQVVPFTEAKPQDWSNGSGFGGGSSTYVYNNGSGWNEYAYTDTISGQKVNIADLSFELK